MITEILARPLASEVLSGGKALYLRLTDSLGFLICPGTLVAFSVLEEDGEPRLTLTVPMRIWNESKFEDGIIRNLSLEMVGYGDGYTPFDGFIGMKGAYLVPSLDYVLSEVVLSAECLKKSSNNQILIENLKCFRDGNRRILESVFIPRDGIKELCIEFRCPLGIKHVDELKGKFKICIESEIFFPSAMTNKQITLFEFDVKTDFYLINNTIELESTLDDYLSWKDLKPLSETLKLDF